MLEVKKRHINMMKLEELLNQHQRMELQNIHMMIMEILLSIKMKKQKQICHMEVTIN